MTIVTLLLKGSPPRVRGIVWSGVCVKLFQRITPARAGNREKLAEAIHVD